MVVFLGSISWNGFLLGFCFFCHSFQNTTFSILQNAMFKGKEFFFHCVTFEISNVLMAKNLSYRYWEGYSERTYPRWEAAMRYSTSAAVVKKDHLLRQRCKRESRSSGSRHHIILVQTQPKEADGASNNLWTEDELGIWLRHGHLNPYKGTEQDIAVWKVLRDVYCLHLHIYNEDHCYEPRSMGNIPEEL